jgi:hypothetical protein
VFAQLGRRFVPKNVGYACRVFARRRFIARLKRSRRMVAYQVAPVPEIPPQVNTVTFAIKPAHTMNGTLDGQVGLSAATERFHREVPASRARYGSLYPGSYFRVREAAALKRAIEVQDKLREVYFRNFDASALGSFLSLGKDAEAARRINNPSGVADDNSGAVASSRSKQGDIERKRQQVAGRFSEPAAAARALLAFAAWQTRMEDIQIRAGKRNIVNSYVWNAHGGLRAETQQFTSTIQHTIGSSSSLDVALGGGIDFAIGALRLGFTPQGSLTMTETLSKSKRTSRTMALNVDLSGVESAGITDAYDVPLSPGEKVRCYSFMTSYLENSRQNFHDFFNTGVDPEWLASNFEEARALRQVDRGTHNEVWRVRHRVTSVERPVLAGFGAGESTAGSSARVAGAGG